MKGSDCWKMPYLTRGAAYHALMAQKRKAGVEAAKSAGSHGSFDVYECPTCQWWHLGHRLPELYRRELMKNWNKYIDD